MGLPQQRRASNLDSCECPPFAVSHISTLGRQVLVSESLCFERTLLDGARVMDISYLSAHLLSLGH